MEGASILDMQKYWMDRMSKFEDELQNKATSIAATGSLAEEFAAFKQFVLQSLKQFSQHLHTMARSIDNMEMRSRRKILLLHGVQEQKEEDTATVVTDVVKQRLKMGTFTPADIRRCHRMGRQSSDKPRPILIKFQSVAVRDSVWFSKVNLKSSGITLSEFLTRSRYVGFMAARDRFGVDKCWTREGYVYVLASDGKRHRITSISDLDNIKDTDSAKASKTVPTRSRRAATKK